MTDLWYLYLFWGLAVGIGTGAIGGVVGATVATRWFRSHRGLVIGLFAAAASMGQLLFLPTLVAITVSSGWRAAVGAMALAVVIATVPLAIFLRNRPEDVGLRRYGDDGSAAAVAADAAEDSRTTTIRGAVRSGDFWLLASSFFVCGYTSNGLIGTHLIPHAIDHGYSEVTAATAVGVMGLMNVVGTLGSGWLTDRYDNRRLLAVYYGLRAVGIASLPFISGVPALFGFAIVYGLDWIATVPPTTNLTAQLFGRASLGTIYGWIFFAHMAGAALAALLGGIAYDVLGDYSLVFLSAAALGFIAAALAMRVSVDGTQAQATTTSVPQT
jgi:MFS family permease